MAGYDPGPVYVRSVGGKVTLGQGFVRALRFPPLLPVHKCAICKICCAYPKDQWRSLGMAREVLLLSRQTDFPVGHELRPIKKVYDLNITSVYD